MYVQETRERGEAVAFHAAVIELKKNALGVNLGTLNQVQMCAGALPRDKTADMKPRRVGPRARTCSGPNKNHKKQSNQRKTQNTQGRCQHRKLAWSPTTTPHTPKNPPNITHPEYIYFLLYHNTFPVNSQNPTKKKKTRTITRHPPPTGWRPPRICILRATNLRANETASTHRPTGTRHNILKQTPLYRRRKWVVCPEPSILEPFAQHTSHPIPKP